MMSHIQTRDQLVYFLTNVNKFWIDLADLIFYLMNINYCFTLKDVIEYYENKS